MPEIEREFELDEPPEVVWEYLTDMENFAQHVPGYKDFEEVDDSTSYWTIEVDLSMFTREMTFQVDVTEDEYPRGSFELDPEEQPGSGSGTVIFKEPESGKTKIEFILQGEASGRMSPFLDKVIGKALPHISDNLIDNIEDADISSNKVAN
jgi:carbon monoxide dehydrogenase subunit G